MEPDQFRHHDIYQLLAYCTASDVAWGLLIYPAHEVPIRDEVHIRNTSVSVRQTTINLGGYGELLRQACDRLDGAGRGDSLREQYQILAIQTCGDQWT